MTRATISGISPFFIVEDVAAFWLRQFTVEDLDGNRFYFHHD
jgi:hypothetical protein